MKSVLIPAGVALALLVCPAKADDADRTPDVISCLKAVVSLEMHDRSWMQLQCFGVAADICVALDPGTGACWSELVGSMRAFYTALSQRLPKTIEGKRLQARGYERALKPAADPFEDVPECAELDGPAFTKCEYTSLGVPTIDLFYRARQAGVTLP